MKNIILCGKMGSGKSTVAKILQQYGYKEVSLGRMVKIITHSLQKAVLMGETEKYINQLSVAIGGTKNDDFCDKIRGVACYLSEIGPTRNKGLLRFAYQQLATEGVRTYFPGTWIKFAQRKALTHNNQGFPVVISDARLLDEYTAFLHAGYIPFKVIAPLNLRIKRLKERDKNFNPEMLNHSSETFNFDCSVINNNGTFEDLKEEIVKQLLNFNLNEGVLCDQTKKVVAP